MQKQANTYVVYKHTSPSNKSYIGYTKNIDRRSGEHEKANGSNPAFHNAVKLYGWDTIQTEILADNLTEIEAKSLEIYYIKKLDTLVPNGYNLTKGGDGNGAKYGKDNVRATAVRALNILTMEERSFDTINEAAEFCKIHPAQISVIIKNVEDMNFKENKVCWLADHTYTFQKYDPNNPHKPFDLSKMRTKEEDSEYRMKGAKYSKPVIGIHETGFTVEYNSTHEAERNLKIQHGYVSRNARGLLGPVGGYSWIFKDLEERKKYPVWSSKGRCGNPGKTIIRTKDDIIIKFETIADAIQKTKFSRYKINTLLQDNKQDIDGYYWHIE